MIRQPVFLLSLAGLLIAHPAAAQTASATPQADPAQTQSDTTTVTVEAKKAAVTRKIDRTVYDENQNPQGQAGTAADVLNIVPAVHVTPDGAVTVHGDSHVEIYVNGKPSAAMAPEARALTLQSIAGSDIASVEVITNPPANYDSNGARILNLVLKKNRKPGASATLNANQGDEGRRNIAISGDLTRGALSLHGSVGGREDIRQHEDRSHTIWTAPDGTPQGTSDQSVAGRPRRFSRSFTAGLDYNLTDRDTLSLDNSARSNHARNPVDEYHSDYDASGTLTDAYDRHSAGPRRQDDASLSATWDHRAASGDGFKLQLSDSRSSGRTDKSYTNIFTTPVQPESLSRVLGKTTRHLDELGGDGVVATGANSQLSFGIDLQALRNAFANLDAAIDTSGQQTPDAQLTNGFVTQQDIAAAYLTWQVKTGKLTLLAGVRYEHAALKAQSTAQTIAPLPVIANLNPSLHLAYDLDDVHQLTMSLTQSTERPDPRDLNPATTYVDAQNVTTGNPLLGPQRVTALEAAYAITRGGFSASWSFNARHSTHTVTDYSVFGGDDKLHTTKLNAGSGATTGLAYEMSDKASDALSYDLSGEIFTARLDAYDLGGRVSHRGTSFTAKAGVDYDAETFGQWNIEANLNGRTVTAQGWRSGTTQIDLTWRKPLRPNLNLVASLYDLTNGAKIHSSTRTRSVDQTATTFNAGQSLLIGLQYRLGGKH